MKKLFSVILLLAAFHAGYSQAGERDAALTSLGALGAVSLYNTYLSLGLMADAHAHEVYETDYVTTLVEEQIGMMQQMKDNLKELLASGFLTEADDKDFASEMVTCAGLLQDEAQALKKYLDDDTEENINSFDTARLYAWDKIAILLELD